MKIGFISQHFVPEPGAAAHPTVVARALAARGHEVVVLTGFPSYPEGRVYDGYRQTWRRTEQIDGMTVHRLPYFLSHDTSPLRRAASMSSFGLSATLQAHVLRDVDVVLVYASPATTAMPAVALARLTNKPFAMYIQDLWPDSVIASGFVSGRRAARWVESALHRACQIAYQHAGRIAVIAPGMARVLADRGVADGKIDVVPNWVDESVFKPAQACPDLARHFSTQGDFTVMYAGGVGELQGLETVVDAMAALSDRGGNVHLAIVGEGVAKAGLEAQVRALGLRNVSFWPGRPLGKMPAVMAAADVQLIPLRDRALFRATIPSKLQATMACGLPSIVSAPGDAAALIEEAGGGIAVPPESPYEMAAAIESLRSMSPDQRQKMGSRAEKFYLSNLAEEVGARRLERVLRAASS